MVQADVGYHALASHELDAVGRLGGHTDPPSGLDPRHPGTEGFVPSNTGRVLEKGRGDPSGTEDVLDEAYAVEGVRPTPHHAPWFPEGAMDGAVSAGPETR